MLIGLAGAAGAGKDTVAEHLVNRHGFVRMALADPLYEMLSHLTGLPAGHLMRRDVKEAPLGWLGVSPRRMLQTLGTEWGRGLIDDDIWIKHLLRRIDASGSPVAVSDVRFDNEAAAIRGRGGIIVEVVRPEPLSGVSSEARNHSSESGISSAFVDVVIVNGGTVNDLHAAVDQEFRWLQSDTIEVR
jgi:hypothetical protein